MDTFIGLAKQGYNAYQESQDDVSKTGGQEYNSSHNRPSRNDDDYEGPNLDHDEVVRNAERHGSGGSDLFSSAMSFLSSNKGAAKDEPVDEERVTQAHEKAYNQDSAGDLSAHDIGGAAALQVLKRFTSGSSGSSSGSSSQSELISLAMAEATKLFDKSGGAASGNKQDAVNGAAMTVMKLLVQSKFGGGTMGGGNSGGLGGLMGLAAL
ncbi:beta-flanking protein [Agrocybe pediades]|nr:beta-flanking protein [Agrocybe pediades]